MMAKPWLTAVSTLARSTSPRGPIYARCTRASGLIEDDAVAIRIAEETCNRGRPRCRRVISGTDWQQPELQAKYSGYFSTYLQLMIQAR